MENYSICRRLVLFSLNKIDLFLTPKTIKILQIKEISKIFSEQNEGKVLMFNFIMFWFKLIVGLGNWSGNFPNHNCNPASDQSRKLHILFKQSAYTSNKIHQNSCKKNQRTLYELLIVNVVCINICLIKLLIIGK